MKLGRFTSALALGGALTVAGCGATETLWSAKAISPSGTYTATAETENTDTIGNVEYTYVRIKEAGFWHRSRLVIVFDGIDYEQNFQMKWSTPSHFDIVVRGNEPTPIQYRVVSQPDPVTFSVHYIQNP